MSPEDAADYGSLTAKDHPHDAPYILIPLYAAPPQERVSEAIPLPTDDEAWDLYRGIRRMFPDEQEAITRFARALTAALAPSRRAPSGDGGGRDA
jgi:hypothetical protein